MKRGGRVLAVLVVALACAGSAAALTPNDPTWNQAWALRQVGMPRAWDITTGDPSVVIADIDTGVDPTVPDLQGALAPGWDFVENDATPVDQMGHGTIVASELVGRGNNGQGVAGYCWRCRVMPIRVSRTGDDFSGTLAANGIYWAVDHGARIISLSFNDEGTMALGDPQVAGAIGYAWSHNVLVFASAGNTGTTVQTHPASAAGAFAVTGTDQSDALFSWATRGPWVHLAAPGCQMVIRLTGPDQACGSSVAAPAAAGIAGLMLSVNPGLSPGQVVAAMQATAVPVAGIDGGRIDALRALLYVGGKLPTPPAPPPPPPPPPASKKLLKPPARPKMRTRVQRGVLEAHRVARINVQSGRVAATLHSAKARSCSVSLKSSSDVWASASQNRDAVSVAAKVPAGRYKVDIWCRVRRPQKFSLYLRAIFA